MLHIVPERVTDGWPSSSAAQTGFGTQFLVALLGLLHIKMASQVATGSTASLNMVVRGPVVLACHD
jgi:hypothetical protein